MYPGARIQTCLIVSESCLNPGAVIQTHLIATDYSTLTQNPTSKKRMIADRRGSRRSRLPSMNVKSKSLKALKVPIFKVPIFPGTGLPGTSLVGTSLRGTSLPGTTFRYRPFPTFDVTSMEVELNEH